MSSTKKTISYRFDSVGNRVGMTDPDGGRFTYAYDAVNRISHLVNPQGDRTTYAYDPGGRRTVKKLANGTRASFSYDTASNLTRLANLKSDGTTISSFGYQYDRVGNRTSVLEADASRVTWSYDDTYQLTGEHRTGSHAYRDTYTYDPAGNRLLKIHDGARTTYSYDAANQLEWSEDASGRTTYTFDADGNQERVLEPNGDRTTSSWDYENRTTLVQLPSGIRNTMAYEPGGLRVKLQESTATKKFVWDAQNYLAETDENDDTQVVYTNEPDGYGNLLSQRRPPDTSWYLFDAIGSTRELTNNAAAVTDDVTFDAWGSVVQLSGTTVARLDWLAQIGYYSDFGHTVAYVRNRHYLIPLARWSTMDTMVRRDWLNRYFYVHNRPLIATDPSGERAIGIGPVQPGRVPFWPPYPCCCRKVPKYHIPFCPPIPIIGSKRPPTFPFWCSITVCTVEVNPCATYTNYCGSYFDPTWQQTCEPGSECGNAYGPPLEPPPKSPPGPGDACYYPNRRVSYAGLHWESQCVCQCAGNSPGLNCIRGCIQCSHDAGAPVDIQAEQFCEEFCPPLTPNEQARLDCCLNTDFNRGGCAGTFYLPAPMNPNPNNPRCTGMPVP